MIFYPTTACPNFDVYPVPKQRADAMSCYVKVGCRRCAVCEQERLEQKQSKWRNRLREMILHYQSNGDRVIFCTFTVHDDDKELWSFEDGDGMTAEQKQYDCLKGRLSKMFNATKMVVSRWYDTKRPSELLKYWAVLEYGEKTGRLHAHVFFFVDKSVAWQGLWAWMTAYWTDRYLAYILHSKLVSNASMAAAYATKYAVKQVGYNRDRMLSSQFGWERFMKEVKKVWLGIEKDVEGIRKWEVVQRPDISERDALRVLNGDVEGAIKLVDQYKVVGRLVVDRPVLHPFAGCILQYEGDFLCEENVDETEMLTMPPTLMFLPANYGLQRLRQLGLGRLSREFELSRDL